MKRAQHCLTVPRGNPSNLYANARSHTHARRLLGFFFPLYSSLSSCALFFFACIPPPPAFTPFFLLYDCAFFFFFLACASLYVYVLVSLILALSRSLFILASRWRLHKEETETNRKGEKGSDLMQTSNIWALFQALAHTCPFPHITGEPGEPISPEKDNKKKTEDKIKVMYT